ncbi:MAG: glycosyltransferase [Clostridia bacterium]|nr:glycosyltransferase [Clostridia bacterium]
MFKYDISIVIPIYNMEKYLKECLDSILKQDYDLSKIQVIAVNDGSVDSSADIVRGYEKEYSNIKLIDTKNGGVASARNKGIKAAQGKYILFLDPDDYLNECAVSKLISFYDAHYDEVDLVSYKIIPFDDETKKEHKLHFRYDYLINEGIYDLTQFENIYANITTINYCIKNKLDKTELFDIDLKWHEDQEFSIRIIKDKLKIGYCPDAIYYYRKVPSTTTGTKSYAYYIFDNTIEFWERLFNEYDKVPEYFQALFMNDCGWKLQKGILHPYHHLGDDYDKNWNRVRKLLDKVNDRVILNHPNVDKLHIYYFISQKLNKNITVDIADRNPYFVVYNDSNIIYAGDKIQMDIIKCSFGKNKVKLMCVLSSPLLLFSDKPTVICYIDNKKYQTIELKESAHSYSKSKEKTSKSYYFEAILDTENIENIRFKVEINTKVIEVKTTKVCNKLIFNNNDCQYMIDNKIYKFNENFIKIIQADKKNVKQYNKLTLSNLIKAGYRHIVIGMLAKLKNKRKKEIWIYYDCKGVKKDNGYYQFVHDLKIKDGIKRYYITNNNNKFNKGLFKGINKSRIVKFKSLKHILLYLTCDKIITAYIEPNNYKPISDKTYAKYFNVASKPEIIYLQHGVLHASMPHKYSIDRLAIDRIVASTYFEKENFINNYNYSESNVITCGMPRYDFTDLKTEKKNAILFAPSWRKYLVGEKRGEFSPLKDIFESSKYYKEMQALIDSEELAELLEKHNMELDFSLHPIFKCYSKMFKAKSDRINIGKKYKDSEYKVFITDFSSFVFDFIYQKMPLIYFVPDYYEFRAGLNLYRKLDMPLEDSCGEFVQTGEGCIQALKKILENNCEALSKYYDKMDNFFIHYDNNQRDRLYKELREGKV